MKVLIKYIVSGGVGAVIQFSGFFFFTQILGIWYISAVFLAFLVALAVVFLMQKFWTFSSYSSLNFERQFFGYTLVALGSAFLNAGLMHILVSSIDMNHLLAEALVIVSITPVSYVINRNVVFALEVSSK